MIEVLTYTVVAIALYFVADWILEQIEVQRGRRFEQRTLLFFCILTLLALSGFALIRLLLGS